MGVEGSLCNCIQEVRVLGKVAVVALGANGWYCADTIEQLAEYIGVEPAALSATVEQYNKVCAEGYDSDFAASKLPFMASTTAGMSYSNA